MKHRFVTMIATFFCAHLLWTPATHADEGFWTFDNFPSKTVASKYGFASSQAWLDHVRLSSLRIAGGCSASFISPHGLVMTNHHCVVDCVQALSTAQSNLVQSGFLAKSEADERPCPAFELDQLVEIRDVTPSVHAALEGKTGDAANAALRAERARLQQSCGSDPSVRCDVVSLYHGGIYDLYHYKRYTDVRLVFAPEFVVAQFGGDPDNFNFPRFDYDIGLLRAYEGGHPVASANYLGWSASGSKDGQLVFVSGNPGPTRREATMSQIEFARDHSLPALMPDLAEYRGLLEQFMTMGPEQEREANEIEFEVANSFKGELGIQQALMDPQFFATKAQEEQHLRAAVANDPKLAPEASAWSDMARIQTERVKLFTQHESMDNSGLNGGILGQAIMLVRAATERTKPNAERLAEYTDQALVSIQQSLTAPTPVYKDLEELTLRYNFTTIQRNLGADDPFVRKMLGKESPDQLAHRLIAGTHLDDAKVREALYNGGQAAISASDDPMIRFAVLIDSDLRADRTQYEAAVDAPSRAAGQRIAKLRFAIYGQSTYPDATFTVRLTYGTVKGFNDARGKWVQPYTTIAGLFERANGAPPFVLPQSWLEARPKLNLATPMNFSTTNDIIGGNSGSPVIDQDGNIVGLIFDGNIFSLGGSYGYDPILNRAVAVDSRALLEGLRVVYRAQRIVDEIDAAQTKSPAKAP